MHTYEHKIGTKQKRHCIMSWSVLWILKLGMQRCLRRRLLIMGREGIYTAKVCAQHTHTHWACSIGARQRPGGCIAWCHRDRQRWTGERVIISIFISTHYCEGELIKWVCDCRYRSQIGACVLYFLCSCKCVHKFWCVVIDIHQKPTHHMRKTICCWFAYLKCSGTQAQTTAYTYTETGASSATPVKPSTATLPRCRAYTQFNYSFACEPIYFSSSCYSVWLFFFSFLSMCCFKFVSVFHLYMTFSFTVNFVGRDMQWLPVHRCTQRNCFPSHRAMKKKKQPTECEYNEVRSIIIFSNGVVFRLESIQLEKLKGRNAHTSKHTGV